jgi:hypothetical protein
VVEHRLWLELIDEMLHAEALNEPPTPPALHETLPAGVEGVPWDVSVTVTLNVTLPPATTEVADEEMLMLDERWVIVTWTVPVPLSRPVRSVAVYGNESMPT